MQAICLDTIRLIADDELYTLSKADRFIFVKIVEELMNGVDVTGWEENNDYDLSPERIIFDGLLEFMDTYDMQSIYELDEACSDNPNEVIDWICKHYAVNR